MEQNQQQIDRQAIRKSQIKFLLVAALFILPVAGALYLNLSGWRPTSTINHGTLVQPARPAPELILSTGKDAKFSSKGFEGKWNLLVVVDGACDKACVNNLYIIRQIHTAQGKHQHRVRRLLIHTGKDTALKKLQKTYPEMVVLESDKATLATLEGWMSVAGQPRNLTGARVFVIDPLGNYMMYYAAGSEPAKMRKDLARLLRVSHIG